MNWYTDPILYFNANVQFILEKKVPYSKRTKPQATACRKKYKIENIKMEIVLKSLYQIL